MTSPAVVQPWRSALFLFAVVCTANAGRSHRRDVSTLDSLHLYPRPAYLPIMPYYEVDIPEQEGKFFGVMAATRYETVSIPLLTRLHTSWSRLRSRRRYHADIFLGANKGIWIERSGGTVRIVPVVVLYV